MQHLVEDYVRVRARTEALAAPLSPEDQLLQAAPEMSPVKWHRAHTTWFFETFVLLPRGASAFAPMWGKLFNSYYESVGPRHARPHRGLLSRPTAQEVGDWRRNVDNRMIDLLSTPALDADLLGLVRVGLAHEEQHQELMLTDLLAAFACNPLKPVYRAAPAAEDVENVAGLSWLQHPGGLVDVGAPEELPFAFDNERPRHRVHLQPFLLANRLVTVREWQAFAADGGYSTASLWLSDGLQWVRDHNVKAPAYTRIDGDAVIIYGLAGERQAHPDEPIMHLSFYEADALATYLDARLPTESEWEAVAVTATLEPCESEVARLYTKPQQGSGVLALYDSAWQWTRSSYEPYPGFRAAPGALGEYNGKFMVNQQVLRGGSLFTPAGHTRASYRNFWPPATQFQATGLRLARD